MVIDCFIIENIPKVEPDNVLAAKIVNANKNALLRRFPIEKKARFKLLLKFTGKIKCVLFLKIYFLKLFMSYTNNSQI